MKALVIRQPWAWAVIEGHKAAENRSWTTRYRGPLVIVAGGSRASLARGTAFCRSLGLDVPPHLDFGGILGIVILRDVVRPSEVDDPFAEGPWCWLLESPVKLEQPVPYRRGRLGLFELGGCPQTESLAAIAANRLGAVS